MKRRVVVTGVGVVAPNGVGKEAFWQALLKGHSGVRPIRRFDPTPSKSQIAGEIEGFDPLAYFTAQEIKKVDRSNVYAMAAGLMALQDAHLKVGDCNPERVGSSIGNAACGVEYAQQESAVIHGRGPRWGSPYLAIAFFSCGSNGLLSIRLGAKGPVLTFCNGNTSGSDAIGMGFRMIQSDRADVMLAGGTEAPLIPLFINSLSRDGWLSQRNHEPEEASRPFDSQADGMVLGEGAGILVLEEAEHAKARNARIYAELSGYSSVSSAYSIFDPEPNGLGLVRTMQDVLQQADCSQNDVGYINAQGFSIPRFDRMEVRCVREVFAASAVTPKMGAVSSLIGNTIGASGGIQAVISALALSEQVIPPQRAVQRAAEDGGVSLAAAVPEHGRLHSVIQNSFCFMGKHSSLIFQRV
jgi:3-oxoacyl-[acyl-carrier-protein] synthase II